MHPQPRRDAGGTAMSVLPAAAPMRAEDKHPALLGREWGFLCVSVTLVTGSDITRAGY